MPWPRANSQTVPRCRTGLRSACARRGLAGRHGCGPAARRARAGGSPGALAVAGGGAGGPGGAGLALALGEAGDDERGGVGRGGRVGAVPAPADLALRAGDFLAVVVDAEVVAGVALLDAVLAGAVTRQRPGEGDLVLAPGPLHVDQGSVAAIDQVLGGEQAPARQPAVDTGPGQRAGAGGRHGGDIGDDVGAVIGAGLGHVGEVSGPPGDLAPAGVAGG